ncbi:hypothetical protein NL676_020478 [Syzygium grande]|nr:hypothetical protein NL676_020478 [Syzygium grande]
MDRDRVVSKTWYNEEKNRGIQRNIMSTSRNLKCRLKSLGALMGFVHEDAYFWDPYCRSTYVDTFVRVEFSPAVPFDDKSPPSMLNGIGEDSSHIIC